MKSSDLLKQINVKVPPRPELRHEFPPFLPTNKQQTQKSKQVEAEKYLCSRENTRLLLLMNSRLKTAAEPEQDPSFLCEGTCGHPETSQTSSNKDVSRRRSVLTVERDAGDTEQEATCATNTASGNTVRRENKGSAGILGLPLLCRPLHLWTVSRLGLKEC
ncbi:uncharacterized protein V6R79_010115 [Siganus canaliculatus]